MKTTIFSKTKKDGLGIQNGNEVNVVLNRYARGYWPTSLNGYTHEYELLINGKVAYTFRMSLTKAKQFAEKTLFNEWIAANPW